MIGTATAAELSFDLPRSTLVQHSLLECPKLLLCLFLVLSLVDYVVMMLVPNLACLDSRVTHVLADIDG